MKGLILKDLMCLRKQLTIFCFVTVGVLAVSVMYVLSARFGNIALAGQQMLEENDMSALDVQNIATNVLVLFMLLPIATVGDMANIFEDDGKNGFYKIASVMPLSVSRRVMARYITIFAMFGIGTLVDILIAFVLSLLTDLISFADFLGIIISAASIMSIYSALVIVFCIILGYGKENYARLLSPALIIVVAGAVNFNKIKAFLLGSDTNLFNDFFTFIKHKSYILLIIALAVTAASYLISAYAADRKRGVM
jgi:hypothetical protein